MTLVVEDGTGLANAESPQSIAAIDLYFETHDNPGWAGAESEKERAARRASLKMEALFGYRVPGVKKTLGQALSFPRVGAYAPDGTPIAADAVPDWWNAMHAELAARARATELFPDHDATSRMTGWSRGPTDALPSFSFSYGSGAGSSGTDYTILEAIGGRYLRPAGEIG